MLKHSTLEGSPSETRETGECIDISGSGVSMLLPEKLNKETILELTIEPPI